MTNRRNFLKLGMVVVFGTHIKRIKTLSYLCCPLCKTSDSIEVHSVRGGEGYIKLPTGNSVHLRLNDWSRCLSCSRRYGFNSDYPGSGIYFAYTKTNPKKYVIHHSHGGSVNFLFRAKYGKTTLKPV